MTTSRDVDELERAIDRAHQAGDKAELARLQAEYRSVATTERISPEPIELRWGAQRSRSSDRPAAPSKEVAMKPRTCYLTVRAQEDLRELNLGEQGHLEQGGIIIGTYDPDRGTVVVEQLRRNIFVKPTSAWTTTVDTEAMVALDQPGRRVVGDWHTHVAAGDVEPSEADYEGWRRAGTDLGEPAYCGLILTPIDVWWEGMPRSSWDEPEAPTVTAWAATPAGTVHRLAVTREPAWYAAAASKVRFRTEEPNA